MTSADMSSDGQLSPPAKERTTSDFNALSDDDLVAILKWLPPYDRLRVSEVCTRWHALSRRPWLDVVYLDLSPIREENIVAIIKQCPNLQTVFAQGKAFPAKSLHILSRIPLVAVTLRHCTVFLRESDDIVNGSFATLFSSEFENASWQELTLSELELTFRCSVTTRLQKVSFPLSLPAAMRRLQLSNVQFNWQLNGCRLVLNPNLDPRIRLQGGTLLDGLERCQQLECLIMEGTEPMQHGAACPIFEAFWWGDIYEKIGSLSNLRELYLGSSESLGARTSILSPIYKLPKLEVLFLYNMPIGEEEDDDVDDEQEQSGVATLKQLISGHPTLRILVLAGSIDVVEEFELPARRRYPNGLASPPAPFLHIFFDEFVYEVITLPATGLEAAKTYQITDKRLDWFLEREDIAPIFEGVWIAGQIREYYRRADEFADASKN